MSSQSHWSDVIDLLADPVDGTPLELDSDRRALRGGDGRRYLIQDGQPILLPANPRASRRWTFPAVVAGQQSELRASTLSRRRVRDSLRASLRPGSSNQHAVSQLVQHLPDHDGDLTVLVIGGGRESPEIREITRLASARVVTFDVYPSTHTTFVGDGHQIPIRPDSIDAVWIQAVLEHVVEPHVVVDEIHRVLRRDGLVYAETPFLQPVHEAAFDFTRFTQSGHRLLFGGFDEITSGSIGGPGAMLSLALRGIAGGLTRRRQVARTTYALTSWLAIVDRLVPPAWRSDFATGVYFLGSKSDTAQLQLFDPAAAYKGAQ